MKVPTTDEIIIGAERELMSDFSVGVNYTYRKYNNLFTTRFEKTAGAGDYYTPADWVLSGRTAGGISCSALLWQVIRRSTARSQSTLPERRFATALSSARSRRPAAWRCTSSARAFRCRVNRVLTTRPNYSQKYSGIRADGHEAACRTSGCSAETSVTTTTPRIVRRRRVRQSYAALPTIAGVSGGRAAALVARLPRSRPAPARSATTSSTRSGTPTSPARYIAPWDINLGASLSAPSGLSAPVPLERERLPGGTITVVLDPMGDKRFDNVYELDLRIAKDFRFMNRVGLTLSGDLFNAPNKRTVLQRETRSSMQNADADRERRLPLRPATASPRCSRRASGDSARSSTSKLLDSSLSKNGPPELLRRAVFCFTPSQKVC